MMKKIALILGATMILFGISSVYASPARLCQNYAGFSIEGPYQHDFLLLTQERPYLFKSLYHIPADVYFGPDTLAQMSMNYDLCNPM